MNIFNTESSSWEPDNLETAKKANTPAAMAVGTDMKTFSEIQQTYHAEIPATAAAAVDFAPENAIFFRPSPPMRFFR